MKRLASALRILGLALLVPSTALAASNAQVADFTKTTLDTFAGFAALAASLFLIRGAYAYITSTGNPAALVDAKKTIRNSLIGLVVVLAAAVIASLLDSALTSPAAGGTGTALSLTPITPATVDGSLTQIILDAVSGFLQNIVQSATKPVLDAITGFLTSTPALSANSAVFNLWLVMVGIADSLFALVVALLGLQVMSATTFGFEEVSFRELLPRIGLAFLAANLSIFVIDWAILLCQTLVSAVLSATGGLAHAWVLSAFSPASIVSGTTLLITLIFMAVFLVLAVALLLFYVIRLMVLAIGAVLAPLVCLLWLVPKMADFAEGAVKSYLVMLFSVFVHVVIIQLASSFLSVPDQTGANPLISILVGIAMLLVVLKSAGVMLQLVLSSHSTGALRKFGGQLFNVLSPAAGAPASTARRAAK